MSDNLLGSIGRNGIQFVELCLFNPSARILLQIIHSRGKAHYPSLSWQNNSLNDLRSRCNAPRGRDARVDTRNRNTRPEHRSAGLEALQFAHSLPASLPASSRVQASCLPHLLIRSDIGSTTTTPPVAILRFPDGPLRLDAATGISSKPACREPSCFTQSSLRYLGPATSPSFSSTTLCWVFFC